MALQPGGSLVKPLVGPGNELYDRLARTSPTAVGKLFRAIDTPGRMVREGLTGRRDATGEDVLRKYGLRTGSRYADVPLGLAAEIALDPLNLLSFGTGAAGKAARAAKAANILDDSPRIVSRMLVDSGEAATRFSDSPSWANLFSKNSVGTRSANTFKKAGYVDDAGALDWAKVTDSDLAARPLVGRSQALRSNLPGMDRRMQLGDLIQHADDPGQALKDVTSFAKRHGQNVDDLKNQSLYKDVGISLLPWKDPIVSFDVPGGETVANALSSLGGLYRGSWAGRQLAKRFDGSVRGTGDEVEQLFARRLSRADDIGAKKAAGRVSDLISSVDPDLLSAARTQQGGRVLRSVIEGTYDLLDDGLKAAAEANGGLMSAANRAKTEELAGKVGKFYEDYLTESAEAGIRANKLTDRYGTKYLGRFLDRDLYPDMAKGGVNTSAKSVLTGDMSARGQEFIVPGGTNTLTDLSGQDFIRDTTLSDRDVAKKVHEFIQAKEAKLPELKDADKYTRGNAMKLTKKLRAMDAGALEDGKRLFAQNPFEIIDKYATGRSKAMARANELQSILAQTAVPGRAADLAGTGYRSMPQSINDLGMRSYIRPPMQDATYGARANIIEKMRGFGIDVDEQTLRNFSVDPELRSRLSNIAEFYADNRQQGEFAKAIGSITRNFKQWVLAVPRRYARDWYSGLFSNWVTFPDARDLYFGYDVTKDVMQQNWESAVKKLKTLPRYEDMTDEEILRTVHREMAQSGMSQTGRLQDLGYENILKDEARDTFAKYLGGDGRPVTTPSYAAWDALTGQADRPSLFSEAYAGSELATRKNWTEDWLPFTRKGFNDPGKATKNPILRASARAAETTDEINRLGGYFAGLSQGYSPEAAAKMVTRAQIDYSSLTPFERKYIGVLFPFWAYLSRVSVWGTKQMLENQTYFNSAIRTPLTLSGNRGEQYAPTRIEERYGVPIPDELRQMAGPLFGSNVEGSTYLSDIDIPFVDSILMVDPSINPETGGINLMQTATNTLQSLAGQTNPMVKSAIENISGRDLYTKTDLDPTRRTAATLARRMGLTDAGSQSIVGGVVDPALSMLLPGTTYPMSTARRLTSEKTTPMQGASQAAFNLLTGTRVETVGPEEELRDIRERVGRYMEGSPYVRKMNVTYIPEEQKPYVSESMLEMHQLEKDITKQLRTLRESRVRGNPLLTY
jgi:hypothetical protein